MKKVLVLDDDESIREIMEIILARAGFAINLVADGTVLLNNNFEEPDLFIIDKQLSGVDGLDICRHLKNRKINAGTPVIIISASNKVETIAIEKGADGFLAKPFQSKKLIELIHSYL